MKILAFDTTNATLSVAILSDQKFIAGQNIFEQNKHSELLIPIIEKCLKQAEIWYQNLDAIAFTNGPGSFTGIRVGLSCAKALGIATDLPVIALNSLEVVAYSYIASCNFGLKGRPEKILVVNDARLEEFFIQEFIIENNQLKSSFEPMMIRVDELQEFLPSERFLLAGSAKNIIKNNLENALIFAEEDFIDAKNIALLAQEKFLANHNYQSSALYIRQPKISQRKVKK